MVVEGQAGVGKTELLRSASALGEAAGMRVLRGRGAELDRAFAFGVVRQLLEREVTQAPDLLMGGAEPAAAVFGTGDGERPAEDGLYGSLQGLHWLVSNLSAQQPLLLVADDLHWADTASLRWLVFLAERLEDIPVLLVAATRPAEPGADQELLDALMTAPAARVLRPAPLSEEATTAFVHGHLPEAVGSFAAACHRATGGNPFLLGELIDELAAGHVRGTAKDATRVPGFGSERVGRAVRRRLRRLRPEALAIARAVAVLGPYATLDQAAALAGVSESAAAASADALVGIHVLAAGRTLDFVHPLVRGAVYEQIPPLQAPDAPRRGGTAAFSARGRERAGRPAPAAAFRPPATRSAWRCCGRPPAMRRGAEQPGPPPTICAARSRSRPTRATAGRSCTSWASRRRPTASATASRATSARRWRPRSRSALAARSRSSSAARSRPAATSAPRSRSSTARCASSGSPTTGSERPWRRSCSRWPRTTSRRRTSRPLAGSAGSRSSRRARSSIRGSGRASCTRWPRPGRRPARRSGWPSA